MTSRLMNDENFKAKHQTSRHVPNHIFSEPPFIAMCIETAKKKFDSPLEQKVYANFLSLKSQALRQQYATDYLIQHNRLKHAEKITRTDAENLIDRCYRTRFALKIVLHRLFRLFKRRIQTNGSVIRAFIDTSEVIFEKEIDQSGIFIYPTTTKLSRQWQLIKNCHKKHPKRYSLMGLPYRLSTAAQCLTTKNFDQLLVEEEIKANKAHQDDFSQHTVQNLYTTDEFECTNVALYDQMSCQVTNVAHGIGVCCPFVGYHNMINFHPLQNQFFRQWNPHIHCTLKPLTIKKNHINNDERTTTVIFVHQPFSQLNLYYEHNIQNHVIIKLSSLCQELNIPFKLKLHPGAKQNEQNHFSDIEKCHQNYLKADRPIYFSLYSSAFFEFIQDGPYFLIAHDLLDPKQFFGDLVEVTTLKKIRSSLVTLKQVDEWQQKQQKQLLRFKHSTEHEPCVE